MARKKQSLKSDDHSTTAIQQSQKQRWLDYACIYTGSLKPMNEVGIDKLANEMVTWAHTDEEALLLSDFWMDKGISETTWWEWCQKFPVLKQAHTTAKCMIGNRREKLGLKRKLDANLVVRTMCHYSQEWRDSEAWRASLREKKKEEFTGPQIVVIEKMPSSDLVPDRKTDNESTDPLV